jgi:nitrogenase subunit NifH
MEDSTTSLLGEVNTKKVLNKQQKELMEFEIHISKLKKNNFEDPQCFESGMVMEHTNHIHKDLDL